MPGKEDLRIMEPNLAKNGKAVEMHERGSAHQVASVDSSRASPLPYISDSKTKAVFTTLRIYPFSLKALLGKFPSTIKFIFYPFQPKADLGKKSEPCSFVWLPALLEKLSANGRKHASTNYDRNINVTLPRAITPGGFSKDITHG